MYLFNTRYTTGLLLAFMLFCNVALFGQCATPVTTFPYVADFETSQDGWSSGGTNSDWAWGTPAKATINTAGSGTKCWITGGLTATFYNYSEASYVQSPCFNFTNLQHPFFSMLIYEETEYKYDGANLQYSLNGGTSWTIVGALNDTSCIEGNWYNYAAVKYLDAPLSLDSNGWCGNTLAPTREGGVSCQGGFGLPGGWILARHCLQNLAGQPSVMFRVAFGAGTTCNHYDGFAFDSVAIGEAIANTGTLTYTCTNSNTVSFTGTAGLPCSDTYAWNFGDPSSASNTAATATATHTFSAPGSYNVTLIISGGPCNAPDTITQAIHILNLTATPQPVSCYNGDNGSVTLTATDGVAPYTYSWTGGITTQNLSNLAAGTYTVTVTAAQSCSATASAVVTQPAVFTATATATGAGCSGGSNGNGTATATGGTSPFSYHWSGGNTPNAQVDGGLTAGTYTVTVTDSKGCTATASCVVGQSNAIVPTTTSTNTTCGASTGSVTLTTTGGTTPYTYVWSNGNTTQNLANVPGNTYTVTVTDAGGCTASASATVAQTGAPTLTLTTVQITCNNDNNGQISTNVTGGMPNYTYAWSNGQSSPGITNLAANTYKVTVTDAQGCFVTASAVIINPAPVVVTLTPQNETCFGSDNGTITSAVTGGTPAYNYVWSNAANTPNLSGLSGGPYSVTVTDQSGCTGSASATLTIPQQITASAASTNASCFGQANGTVTLTVTGGTNPDTYLWSNTATTQNLTAVVGGTYQVTVTDAGQCTATASAIVTTPTQIQIGGTPAAATCFGYSNGGVTTTENGGAGGYTYLWSNAANTQNLSNVANGPYTITVTDASGCTASASFTIGAPPVISIADNPTQVTCFGDADGAITVTASGGSGSGYTYAWSNGAGTATISNLAAATYTVTVTDGNQCTQSATYTITQSSVVTLSTSSTPQSCASKLDGSATVTATGGTPPLTYAWSNQGNTATISNLAAGIYAVTVTDAHQCKYPDSVAVNILAALQLTDTAVPPVCPPLADGSISVLNIAGGTPPYTYIWNGNAGTATLSNLKAGTYLLVVSDANGCTLPADTFVLQYQYSITVTTGPGSTIELGSTTEITSTSNITYGVSYNWSPLEGLDCSTCPSTVAQPVRTGWYYIAVQDSNGCTANDSVLITVIPNYDLFIPNAFTPNGDGNNDYFEMFGNKAAIIFWEIRVFNRWGEKVFESRDVNFGWDGTYKGKLQDPGVFVYEGKAVFLDDHSTRVLKGSVTLIR